MMPGNGGSGPGGKDSSTLVSFRSATRSGALSLLVAALASMATLSGCSGEAGGTNVMGPTGPPPPAGPPPAPPPPGGPALPASSPSDSVHVSEPVPAVLQPTADVARAGRAASNASGEVTYISFPPGTVEVSRDSARIRNSASDTAVTAPLVRGGLDPVALPAAVGDSVDVWILEDDIVTERFIVHVPARRPPKVVRSVPARGEVSVPLNTKVVVILSEPVDPPTVSSASVQLLLGSSVIPTEVSAENGGLFIEITPLAPLERFTEYEVRISDQVRDLAGDRLEAAHVFRFTTGSPAAGKIAYRRLEFENAGSQLPNAIFVVNADGSDVRRLSKQHTLDEDDPEWSPDGSKIAFTRYSARAADYAQIWIMDADGGNAVQLTDDTRRNTDPAWSPDGSEIVYYSCADDGCRIVLMNADGTNRRDLASGWNPHVSPDGSRIVFVYYEPGHEGPYCRREEVFNCAIYVINADGTGLQQIGAELGNYPRWSPDGSQIAFIKNERWSDAVGLQQSTLFIMDANGTNATPVTTGIIHWPSWSPDGSQIAFENAQPYPSMRGAIFTVYADGSGLTTVVPYDYPNSNSRPSWGP